jgi:hypothetical protein
MGWTDRGSDGLAGVLSSVDFSGFLLYFRYYYVLFPICTSLQTKDTDRFYIYDVGTTSNMTLITESPMSRLVEGHICLPHCPC